MTQRLRLNRGGDRQGNRPFTWVVISRIRLRTQDPPSRQVLPTGLVPAGAAGPTGAPSRPTGSPNTDAVQRVSALTA